MGTHNVMYLEYSESTWQLVAMAKSDQLGTSERLQEKTEKISNLPEKLQCPVMMELKYKA